MNFVAAVMDNETVVIGLGLTAVIMALVGVILLITISSASLFVYRVPGGGLTLTGVAVMIAMFSFSLLMTSGMEMVPEKGFKPATRMYVPRELSRLPSSRY